MFVAMEVFLEADQMVKISTDIDNDNGVVVEVFEADGKTTSPRLHLSPKEIGQLWKAIQVVSDLRKE